VAAVVVKTQFFLGGEPGSLCIRTRKEKITTKTPRHQEKRQRNASAVLGGLGALVVKIFSGSQQKWDGVRP
jgi:hypothetical protein